MSKRLDPLFADAIQALESLFIALDLEWAVIGGVAVGLLGEPRATKDVDALIFYDTAEVDQLVETAKVYGFLPRFKDTAGFARESRVAFLLFGEDQVRVDIALGCSPFEQEVLDRSSKVEVGACRIPLPSPEDLIIMKSIASRPHDLADIRSVSEIQPSLDRKRIKYWLTQYGDLLDDPN